MNEIIQYIIIVLGLYFVAMIFSFSEKWEEAACMTLLLMPISMIVGLFFSLNKSPYLTEIPVFVWGVLTTVTVVSTGMRFWFMSRIKVVD